MSSWMGSWSWKKNIALAAVVILTVLAFILGHEWFRCDVTTTTLSCTLEGIGDFPGGNYVCGGSDPTFCSGAYGVSEDGLRVVGHGTVDHFGAPHKEDRMAAVWTSPTGTIGFWDPANPPGLLELGYGSASGDTLHHSFASGISDNGKVVVGSAQSTGVQGPARWIAGVFATLPPAHGDWGGEALKASSDGKIIVGYTIPGGVLPKGNNWSTPRHAQRWRDWGGYSSMVLPDSALEVTTNAGRANAVNWDGEKIVGTVYDHTQPDGSEIKYPVLWWRVLIPGLPPTQPGPNFRLLILRDENGNVSPGEASAISADGAVVAGSLGVYPNLRACYWDVSAIVPPINAKLIPLIAGDCFAIATCVSNIGSLRVYGARSRPSKAPYNCVAGGDSLRSFMWDINDGIQDLQTYMHANGADTTGWRIEQVADASPDGLTLVGTGYHNAVYEGWVFKCRRDVVVTERWCLVKERSVKSPTPPIDP